MKKIWVIRHLKKGYWFYYHEYKEEETWDADLYFARRFASYEEAELFLRLKKNWGGYFDIFTCYVQGDR